MNRINILFVLCCIIACNDLSTKDKGNTNITQRNSIIVEEKTPSVKEVVEIENNDTDQFKRPKKSIIKNLAIDTTYAFGVWTTDIEAPHADFYFTKDSFYVADYDGDGEMPYVLDKNTITVYYEDRIQKGNINTTHKDTLKIKWSDYDIETKYVRFE